MSITAPAVVPGAGELPGVADRELIPGRLPLLTLRMPAFPGNLFDARLAWDYERDAVEAAMKTHGMLLLAGDGGAFTEPRVLEPRYPGSGSLGSVAEVVGRMLREEVVRFRVIDRVRLSELRLPPMPSSATWSPHEDDDSGAPHEAADAIRGALFRLVRSEGQEPPMSIWTASPGHLADLAAPTAFRGRPAAARRAFAAPAPERLRLVMRALAEATGAAGLLDARLAAELVVWEWMRPQGPSYLQSRAGRERH